MPHVFLLSRADSDDVTALARPLTTRAPGLLVAAGRGRSRSTVVDVPAARTPHSGNLSAPGGDGPLVGTFLPGGAEWGLASQSAEANGTFFPEVFLGLRWAVDDKLAFLHIQGVG